uniref:Uncharacterized protein n=1 Tax=Oryza brachyantha TaxID=4533 RepID=J3KV38_ORYBR
MKSGTATSPHTKLRSKIDLVCHSNKLPSHSLSTRMQISSVQKLIWHPKLGMQLWL